MKKNTSTGLEIAVIGMAGRFPGARNVNEYWENLCNGIESIHFFDDVELIKNGVSKKEINASSYVKASARLENKEFFDAALFNYRPDEAMLMDPQMRLFHECVWESLEDAGCIAEHKESKIGVYAGATTNTNWVVYAELINRMGLVDSFTASKLSNARFIASKISHFLNLRGPSIFLDTACSTSLVAIQQACKGLLLGECKIAVAGGVSTNYKSNQGYHYSEGLIYSNDGHCNAFDAKANGTVGGEGVALVVLKTLKNALSDGDNISAVIKGWGVNNDGSGKVGYAAPSIDGQSEAILMAHSWAKIDPRSISYIETHGTGTKLGDPIEIEALNRAFGQSKQPYCAIGSVKANIGHLDAAAGAAGLIKTIMALKHKKIPPSLNFKNANPEINFDKSPFYVNTSLKNWESKEFPLRAGVSSFGIGGTNVHLIVEEAPEVRSALPEKKNHLITISGHSVNALNRNLENLEKYFIENQEGSLTNIAYTLKTGRKALNYRKVVVGSEFREIINHLGAEKANDNTGIENLSPPQNVVFMFSGQGSQYRNMCIDLYTNIPFFRKELDRCFEILNEFSSTDLKSILFPQNELLPDNIDNTACTQPLMFSIEYALASMLMQWGIIPNSMIGHSLGEYVAACIGGVFSLSDALKLVARRGEIMQNLPKGSMLSIAISEKNLLSHVENDDTISIAVINGVDSCVVSGEDKDIEGFKVIMEKEGYTCRLLNTSHAFHSHMMDSILSDFANSFKDIELNETSIPIISNLTGGWVAKKQLGTAEYWVNHLRNTVRFSDGIQTILEGNSSVLIEIGPGRTLTSLANASPYKNDEHKVINTVRHPKEIENDEKYLLKTLGKLWVYGFNIDWNEFYDGAKGNKISLPTYSFEKMKFPVNVDAFKLISQMSSGKGFAEVDKLLKTEWLDSKVKNVTKPIINGQLMSTTEKELLQLWCDFFGKDTIALKDDFFGVGGDSLKALTIVGRINEHFNLNISIANLFKNTTVLQLATEIDSLKKNNDSTQHTRKLVQVAKTKKLDRYVLSSAQKRLYFLHRFDNKSLAYNLPQTISLEGTLDMQKLENSFKQVISRHASLRTYFTLDNMEPVQKISDKVDFNIRLFNEKKSGIDKILKKFIQPFDLEKPPLLRVGLIEQSPKKHLLIFDVHHIVSDGLSQRIILKEIIDNYSNQRQLNKLPIQYVDYAEWQQEMGKTLLKDQKKFWVNEFKKKTSLLYLPLDYARPSVKTYEGDQINFTLGDALSKKLIDFAEENKVTLFMLILSIFKIFLNKLCDEEDVTVGVPTSGRMNAQLENLVGVFINTIAIRNNVQGELTFSQFLQELKVKVLQCFDNQDYQYEDLIDELKLERQTAHNPLFDVFFSFQNIDKIEGAIPGINFKPRQGVEKSSLFDLTLIASENKGLITLGFEYCTKLFRQETVERFVKYFNKVATEALTKPNAKLSEIDLVPKAEKLQLLNGFNDTDLEFSMTETIPSLFEKTVLSNTKNTALTFEDEKISYKLLNERSNQLAWAISERKLGKETVIGILLDRSSEIIVSIMAILKAGYSYLPIDPAYPIDRIEYVLEDSRIELLIIDENTLPIYNSIENQVQILHGNLAEVTDKPTTNLGRLVQPDNLAYVIYTSGSTGNPKGVMIEHRNVINFFHAMRQRINFTKGGVILSLTTISFDIFVLETLVPLLSGMKVVLASSSEKDNPAILTKRIVDEGVQMIQLTPSHLKLFLSMERIEQVFDAVKILLLGGEALPNNLLKELRKKFKGRIYNMYGPTETTVWSTVQDLTNSMDVNIGKPVANTQIRILDKNKQLRPIGTIGELCIGGRGVGRGYWNKETLTKTKFVKDPFIKNGIIYKTGDLAKWLWNGDIEYLGRIDNQIKLRGFRIELGEIESNLKKVKGLSNAVTILRERAGDKFLVSFYTAKKPIHHDVFVDHLSKKLPEYMIPSYFQYLKKLPLTNNGKLDRNALPEIKLQNLASYKAPTTQIEKKLVKIWGEVLQVEGDQIGVSHNFFELGGHSLKATVLSNKINETFGVHVPLKEIFAKQTILALSDYIETISKMNFEPTNNKDFIEVTL